MCMCMYLVSSLLACFVLHCRMARYVQLLSYMEVQDTIRKGGLDNYVDAV